jgi:hypothetical protein
MWSGGRRCCEWLSSCNGLLAFSLPIPAAHVYLQCVDVCGCTSSLLKQSRVLQIHGDSLHVVVVGSRMKFVYSDM